MPYDPLRHNRRSMRLRDYDYTQAGWYFVTICTYDRACIFGEVVEGRMCLNAWGRIAADEWQRTAELRPYVCLDAFVVMPNHVHGLLGVVDRAPRDKNNDCRDTMHRVPTGANTKERDATKRRFGRSVRGSLSHVVGTYKAAVTRRGNAHCGTTGTVWQSRFYDRIVRDDHELGAVRQYIADNPARWCHDRSYR